MEVRCYLRMMPHGEPLYIFDQSFIDHRPMIGDAINPDHEAVRFAKNKGIDITGLDFEITDVVWVSGHIHLIYVAAKHYPVHGPKPDTGIELCEKCVERLIWGSRPTLKDTDSEDKDGKDS